MMIGGERRCMYCHEVVDLSKPHEGIEFINGYPSPCRCSGFDCHSPELWCYSLPIQLK